MPRARYRCSERRVPSKKIVRLPPARAPRGLARKCLHEINPSSRIERTSVSASTIHNLFDLDNTYATKMDLSKGNTEKVARLVQMEVLLLDEYSMLDCDIFRSIATILNLCDHTRKGFIDNNVDEFGDCHMLLFGASSLLPPSFIHSLSLACLRLCRTRAHSCEPLRPRDFK